MNVHVCVVTFCTQITTPDSQFQPLLPLHELRIQIVAIRIKSAKYPSHRVMEKLDVKMEGKQQATVWMS